MKSKSATHKKTAGFFIVEILIVLAIISILVVALLPNLAMYTKRAKFADALTVADSLKPAVELCILNTGTAGSAIGNSCQANTNGIPTNPAGPIGSNVSSVAITSGGVITVTGTSAVDSGTYILTPSYQSGGHVTWAATGTCTSLGLC